MSTFKIASVHFAPLMLTRPNYQGIYKVDAAAPGAPPKYVVSVTRRNNEPREEEGISDKISIERGGFSDSPNPRTRSTRRTTILADEIARDLVNEWVRLPHGASTESHPGLWVVRDRLPEMLEGQIVTDAEGRQQWREASSEERMAMWNEDLAHARQADSGYARFVFDYWDAQIEKYPRMIEALPKMVRLAADAYGWTAEWLRDGSVVETKACQFCTRKVRSSTIVCPHCRETIDYEGYAREMKKRQDSLAAAGVVATDGEVVRTTKAGKAA